MIEMHGCTPGMSWGLLVLGMFIGAAFGLVAAGLLAGAKMAEREWPDVPVDKAPARSMESEG